jgi:hypothetical protein
MKLLLRQRLAARAALLLGALLVCGLLAAGSASAFVYTWNVSMSGQQVIASHLPANASATGTATITGDDSNNRVCGTFHWSGVASPVVAGHIHEGQSGQPENPGVTINLFGPNINGAANGVSGCTIVPNGLIDDMNRYSAYFNVVVHNKQYPAGAIRGQLGCATLLFNWTCSGP